MGVLLAETRIVLVHPTLPENVGAVARAMRHFGLRDLVVAEGGVDPDHPVAHRVAAGADEVLSRAIRVPTLADALFGVAFTVGTTARPYDAPDLRTIPARDAALLARDHALHGPVALVLGTEKHGLTKEALRRCAQVARIPGEPDACLNLAMAAGILAYEWYVADAHASHDEPVPLLAAAAAGDPLAPVATDLEEALVRLGAIKERERASKGHTLRRILTRTRLDPDEAALVRAIARFLRNR